MAKEKLVKERDKMYFNNTYHPTIPQWIPVSERLPENEDYYLVTDDAGGMRTVEISFFVPECESPWDYVNVTAWMPLPKPYTEVRKNNES